MRSYFIATTFFALAAVAGPAEGARMCSAAQRSFALRVPRAIKDAGTDPCQRFPLGIVADVKSHTMFLCKAGNAIKAFRIAIGTEGYGKRKEGDQKTPLGSYPLSAPRPSHEGFGTFIEVGYPTEKQKARGYTGGSVGIHGPAREDACLGMPSVSEDWTDGCLALPSDKSVKVVADFITENPSAHLHVLKLR